jgi:UDP-glucose 4-epimerase
MNVFVAGGAGFIGSHLVRHLLTEGSAENIVVYDNFSSGKMWHLREFIHDPHLNIVKADIKDLPKLSEAIAGAQIVYHFASNPDIAKAMAQPDIDFWEGTYLTQNVLEAMRVSGAKRIVYASGSGIYGETGLVEVIEDSSSFLPISTYGASKLAGEALICAYCHMFEMQGLVFRFANVVGPRQTHGVGYDFVRRLLRDPSQLVILGDGNQSKSYVHVEDVISAMQWIVGQGWRGFEYFNVATEDYITVREIADLVVQRLGLNEVAYAFTGGARGWKGDVPTVRFNTQKLRARGWLNRRTSREALQDSIDSMIRDARERKIDHED